LISRFCLSCPNYDPSVLILAEICKPGAISQVNLPQA
jgi:hypothetical protein